jgi:hypothetical protein
MSQCGTPYVGLLFMSIGIITHKNIFILEKENGAYCNVAEIYATDISC